MLADFVSAKSMTFSKVRLMLTKFRLEKKMLLFSE